MKAEHVTFPCGSLKLEGIYFDVEKEKSPAVVITHPHPFYGGSMKNKVVYAIVGGLVGFDISALIFNFRGVGESEGMYSAGVGEQNDIKAALNWLMQQPSVNAYKMGLAGYSFGGGVALPVAADDARVRALALVSPSFETSPSSTLRAFKKPLLILGGTADNEVSAAKIRVLGKEAAGPATAKIMEGADHLWTGYEKEMSKEVATFFRDIFDRIKERRQGM